MEACSKPFLGVAQPGRALRSGRRGRWFKSSRPETFFETYLDWVKKNRAPGTYRSAVYYLTSFARSLGKLTQLRHISGNHISEWLGQHPNWSSTTASDGVSHVDRAFAWGRRKNYTNRSPVDELDRRPKRRRREVVYSPDDWARIQAAVTDQYFRDFLTFLWETGCRPLEARRLERRHLDLDNQLAVLQPSETKTGQTRVIFLTETALEICSRLSEQHPEGPIFRNRIGNPWKKDAITCRFGRLKEKVKIPGLCAYGFRHSYATEALKNGVDSTSLAVIMGHADVSMIARTYQHLAKNLTYLKEQARKAKASSA